jgi:hypothetical protein
VSQLIFSCIKFDYICAKLNTEKQKAMAKKDYDAINFKNKDVDKLSTKFGQGGKDPLKKVNNTSAPESSNVKTQTFVRPSSQLIKEMANPTQPQTEVKKENRQGRSAG